MKRIDELVNEAFSDELAHVRPEPVDVAHVKLRTLELLGLAPGKESGGEPEALEELAEPVTRRGRKGIRVLAWAAAALAACLALAFGLNAVFPERMEDIPVVGAAFRSLNGHDVPPVKDPVPAVEQEPSSVPTPKVKEAYFEFLVQEAVSDGRTLYVKAQVKSNLDPGAETSQWFYGLAVNGEAPELYDGTSLDTFRSWTKTGEDTYVNDGIVIPLPIGYLSGMEGELHGVLDLTFTDLSKGEDNPRQFMKDIEFDIEPQEGVVIEGGAETNGVRLTRFSASEKHTETVAELDASVYPDIEGITISLYRMDGSQINISEGKAVGPNTLDFYFLPLEPEDKEAVVRVRQSDSDLGFLDPGTILAEFTVNLEKNSAEATSHMEDPDSPLFLNRDLALQGTWAFPSYRAEDGDLNHLLNGYRVEFLTLAPNLNDNGFTLNLVTDREYRDLEVVLRQGVKEITRGKTTSTEKRENGTYGTRELPLFQPFSQYSFDQYDVTKSELDPETLEKLERFRFYTDGELPRELDKSGLNVQTVWLTMSGLTRLGYIPLDLEKPYTVQVLDGKSGSLVMEEEIWLTLPDSVPLEDNQRLVRQCMYLYPYVPLIED